MFAVDKFFSFFLCCDNKFFFYKASSVNEKTIITALTHLRNSIDNLHVTVSKIYVATCHLEETPENSIGIPTLPLTSMEAFYELEDFNLDEEKKLIMVRKCFSSFLYRKYLL